ncbi:hypothetical protein EB796_016673 [Bugula neritina]|uniref:Uncharacterized protein n=1 Tax=Bugula neritina TaxID=10212 RepID=A0A7J7JF96_BUGNE|nr:hypothetical protein EB796_016673 [Bugula neritina]
MKEYIAKITVMLNSNDDNYYRSFVIKLNQTLWVITRLGFMFYSGGLATPETVQSCLMRRLRCCGLDEQEMAA